jgi:DNA gyrase subunit A
MGREAHGVRGMTLAPGQQVISLVVCDDETKPVLIATENGFGKRTPVAEFTRHGRGSQGMIAIQTTARNGRVVAARLVIPEDEVMLITTGGVLIRTRVSEIREMGRATQGVTLIGLSDDEKLAGLERVVERVENGGDDPAGYPADAGNGQDAEGAGGDPTGGAQPDDSGSEDPGRSDPTG